MPFSGGEVKVCRIGGPGGGCEAEPRGFTMVIILFHVQIEHAVPQVCAWYTSVVKAITKNPDILGGTPVFRGTRVPVQTLFDYLEGGETFSGRALLIPFAAELDVTG